MILKEFLTNQLRHRKNLYKQNEPAVPLLIQFENHKRKDEFEETKNFKEREDLQEREDFQESEDFQEKEDFQDSEDLQEREDLQETEDFEEDEDIDRDCLRRESFCENAVKNTVNRIKYGLFRFRNFAIRPITLLMTTLYYGSKIAAAQNNIMSDYPELNFVDYPSTSVVFNQSVDPTFGLKQTNSFMAKQIGSPHSLIVLNEMVTFLSKIRSIPDACLALANEDGFFKVADNFQIKSILTKMLHNVSLSNVGTHTDQCRFIRKFQRSLSCTSGDVPFRFVRDSLIDISGLSSQYCNTFKRTLEGLFIQYYLNESSKPSTTRDDRPAMISALVVGFGLSLLFLYCCFSKIRNCERDQMRRLEIELEAERAKAAELKREREIKIAVESGKLYNLGLMACVIGSHRATNKQDASIAKLYPLIASFAGFTNEEMDLQDSAQDLDNPSDDLNLQEIGQDLDNSSLQVEVTNVSVIEDNKKKSEDKFLKVPLAWIYNLPEIRGAQPNIDIDLTNVAVERPVPVDHVSLEITSAQEEEHGFPSYITVH